MTPALELTRTVAGWLPLADTFVKVSLLLACAAGLAVLLRHSTAASRHLVWTVALLGSLALPLATIAAPEWRVPLVRILDPTLEDRSPVAGSVLTPPLEPATGYASPGRFRDERLLSPSSHAPDRTSRSIDVSWMAWLGIVWAAGTVAILAYLALGLLAAHRISRRTATADGAPWAALAEGLATELAVRRIRFRRGPVRAMPMTLGLFRPTIVMPAEADRWPGDQVRTVLLHELAHVKRADCVTSLISQSCCALYWMNPLVWIAARRAVIERERACDDMVLVHGTSRTEYAAQLLEIARRLGATSLTSGSLAMADRSQLEGRLMAILDPSVPRSGLSRRATCIVVCASLVVLAPLASIQPWVDAEVERVEPAAMVPASTPVPIPSSEAWSSPDAQARHSPDAQVKVPRAETPIERQTSGIETDVQVDELGRAIEEVLRHLPDIVGAAVDGALTASMAVQESQVAADPKVSAALREALKDVDEQVRDSAMLALVRLRDPAVFEALIQNLRSSSADAREKAVFGLAQLRDRRAVDPLIAALKDQMAHVREQVVFALGQFRDERALRPLIEALEDADADVREQAAFALGQLESREAVDALVKALRDADEDVREHAAFALGQIGDPRAIDALTAALKDAVAEVRRQVAFALGRLGEQR